MYKTVVPSMDFHASRMPPKFKIFVILKSDL